MGHPFHGVSQQIEDKAPAADQQEAGDQFKTPVLHEGIEKQVAREIPIARDQGMPGRRSLATGGAGMTPIKDETLYGTPDLPKRPGLDACPARDEQGQCPHWADCTTIVAQAAMALSMIAGD